MRVSLTHSPNASERVRRAPNAGRTAVEDVVVSAPCHSPKHGCTTSRSWSVSPVARPAAASSGRCLCGSQLAQLLSGDALIGSEEILALCFDPPGERAGMEQKPLLASQ